MFLAGPLFSLTLAASLWLFPGAQDEIKVGDFTPWFDARMLRMRLDKEAWQSLPWLTDLGKARRQAAARGRPIFLWAMNGNPLGCT